MDVLVLDGNDVAEMLGEAACIDAVESAFRALGERRVPAPVVSGVHVPGGGFHVKAGVLEYDGRSYFAGKTNANFPGNSARGLPTIQGLVLLFDASDGRPLAVMDSGELTLRRTAAATAVAARHLARPESAVLTICGCGVQARAHLRMLREILPVRRVHAFDIDQDAALRFARDMSSEIEVQAVAEVGRYTRESDVVVTCTPSRTPLLGPDDVPPGCFVAGVGADSEDKQELAPALLARGTLVVDVLEQAATIGDLHHALEDGTLIRASVHAELGDIVAGRTMGRTSADEVTIFDSTGMALQDVAAAALVYRRARGRRP